MPDTTEPTPSLADQLRALADHYGADAVADISRQLCVDEGPTARNPERARAGIGLEEAMENVRATGHAMAASVVRGSVPRWSGGSNRTTEASETIGVDKDAPPPFQLLDLLSNVGRSIDEHLAEVIGRLQPYVTPMPMRGDSIVEHAPGSPLENRITRETDLLVETDQRLIDLLDSLRL